MIPRIEPTAAPISVLSVARRIRISKTMIQMAISAPAAAETQGSSPTGTSLYPAAIKIAVNISRIKTTSACIIRAYYHNRPRLRNLRFRPSVSLNEAMRKTTLSILIAIVCVAGIAASQQSSLKFRVPAGWVEEERTSSMRVAQYRLPKAEGDTEDASLVLYYFGQGQGGSVTANIDRWISQMKQPDGSPVKGAKDEQLVANGLKV